MNHLYPSDTTVIRRVLEEQHASGPKPIDVAWQRPTEPRTRRRLSLGPALNRMRTLIQQFRAEADSGSLSFPDGTPDPGQA